MIIVRKILGRLCSICHSLRSLPGMTPREIKIIKTIFDSYKGKRLKVLEWGCGKSTLYYAKYLNALGINFKWYAIENSKEWHEIMSKKIKKCSLDDKVEIYLFEFTPFWLKAGWDWKKPDPQRFSPQHENEKKYISFPISLDTKFDVIIVDGRFRRRCLIKAYEILDPSGYIILHDALNKHYYSSLDIYKYGKFIDSKFMNRGGVYESARIWIGSNKKKDLLG